MTTMMIVMMMMMMMITYGYEFLKHFYGLVYLLLCH